jgi:acyl transferase domain-containing protein
LKKIKQNTSVAIVGMGCLFPQAAGLKEYWRLLFNSRDAITDVPETHWLSEDYYDADPKKPDHVHCKRGGFISPVSFDPTEFGIPPSSIEATDTAQLLGLFVAKKALEDSGYGADRNFNRDKTSVILGVTGTQELVIPLGARLGHPIWRRALEDSGINSERTEEVIQKISDSYVSWQENSFPGLLGNVVAGRISNRLDLGGTNCVVDAACASSLSAVHLAIMELLLGRSDMVVTGGVDMLNDIFMHMCFAKTMALSSTGNIRPFSKDADGTVLGEGIGIFVLKRLEDAEKDGDRIYAVIKGMGTSSDGKSQSIYAPRAEGQIKALKMAFKEADIDPSTIELVEAHGTGTRVGDIVEFQALNKLFNRSDNSGKWCALGSVKSMIGHAKAAAGAAGLMKAVLSLYNKVLPPTLKADEPDPKLKIDQSPFYLSTETRPWFSKKEHPRRSGVSSFGFGGSNFHVVVEEYNKQKQEISWDGSAEIVALSSSNQKELKKILQSFKTAVVQGASYDEISEKAAKTRYDFTISDQHRLLIVIEESKDLKSIFDSASYAIESKNLEKSWHVDNIFYGCPETFEKIAFVFPGQGSQYLGMGRDLVSSFPDAFKVLENANEKYTNPDRLTDIIYPLPALNEKEKKIQQEILRKTEVAQPAIGAVSIAMLKVLQLFGIKTDATCGHSFGELSALCAAEWIDLDTFLFLSITRGRLMAAAGQNKGRDAGSMLAVQAPLDELDNLIREAQADVILANRNSPNQGVLSGSLKALARAESMCSKKGFKTIKLPVSAAFHSNLVKDAKKPFAQTLKNIDILPSQIPVFSNTTGKPYPEDSDKAKQLLGEHLLSPVNFVGEIENLFAKGVRTFVEVGPKSVLTGLIKSILKDNNIRAIAMDGSSGRRSGMADLARTLCHIASLGHAVDLSRWEKPVQKTRKQLMSIPIAGVNYRKQKTEKRKKGTADREQVAEDRIQPTEFQTSKIDPIKVQELKTKSFKSAPNTGNKDTMRNKQSKNSFILDTLKVTQEGLKSMQTLHTQTAEAHQKFLETQTEMSRTLQKMMENTQRLAEASVGIQAETKTSDLKIEIPEEKTPILTEIHTSSDNQAGEEQPDAQSTRQTPPDPILANVSSGQITPEAFIQEPGLKPKLKQNKIDLEPPGSTRKEIESDMLEVVSQLTGYPTEMLSFDMDIEADLGIDSIKRVEILSTLEEKVPNLPAISPEIMGSLKTLGQILEYLSDSTNKKDALRQESNDVELSSIDNHEIKDNMLEVVSQLTGYPTEMLSFDMDIEADLGIDSIKRVEILSTLEETITNLPTISPEIMGSLKTLGQIVEYLSGSTDRKNSKLQIEVPSYKLSTTYNEAVEKLPEVLSNDVLELSAEYLETNIGRKIVSIVDQQFNQNSQLELPVNRKVFITDDQTGLSEAIKNQFKSLNINADLVSHEMFLDIVKGKKDLKKAAGLVIVPGSKMQDASFLKKAFVLTKHLAQDLLDSAKEGGALFATITRLDGAFCFKGKDIANPLLGGLAGLGKTASIEWEEVCCHAIDIAPEWKENNEIAKAVVGELLNPDPSAPVEIGLGSGLRYTLELKAAPYPNGEIKLNPGEVVVMTGGAKGITASVAYTLSKYAKPILVLLGRSPHPTPEPEWLSSVEGEAAVKKSIFENEFSGNGASPIQLEKAFR